MADTTCRVYSVCNTGRTLVLRIEKEGTRAECNKFIRDRTRNNLPTQYMHVSSLPFEAAQRRYLP